MRKGTPITLYLEDEALAALDGEVAKRAQEDREKGLSGYAVTNRSKLVSEAITYAVMKWKGAEVTVEEIATMTRGIFEEYGLVKVELFGSFARGTQTAQSDVDLLVTLGKPLGLSFFTMKNRLEEVLCRSVDLQTAEAATPELLESIGDERVTIYAA